MHFLVVVLVLPLGETDEPVEVATGTTWAAIAPTLVGRTAPLQLRVTP